MNGRRRRARAVVCVLTALVTTACGASLMKLPSGPGAPAPDVQAAVAEATGKCRAIQSMAADAAVSGSAGGRRLRARLSLGLQAPGSARLEAIGPFARPLFILVARGDEATLLLNDDNRVLERGRPDAVLEALTGVPLGAAGLRETLTGCPSPAAAAGTGRQLGDDWRSVADASGVVYLHREGPRAPWRVVAAIQRPAEGPEWRAEYRDFADGLPATIRLISSEAGRFDLRLAMSEVEVDVPLGPEAFEVKIPASADPITLDELRRSGPLGDRP
jgi:outer membrane lipoprotein-sorting protein